MRTLAFAAPLAALLAVTSVARAQPDSVTVTWGPKLQEQAERLGEREVAQQSERLREAVQRALASHGPLDGARIELVLSELKPNRPTIKQMSRTPGLDGFRSRSIGGATIEGQATLADGSVQPIRYAWYSHNLAEVRGYSTWTDADRAFSRLASNLAAGRYVTR
ncbi:hypothetical protein E4M02_03855 [Brevundimonas sp. S30B]|uniref:hypothetical protein n=1 Tax=unclassified Brevundimonas TaxID=2622653 RepID=UPI0010717A3B|nr:MULTISPECIES: hypothetical protein [unclassified Brevundimonas]QBX36986.1 hypothetical protein E4M01_03960 [Brevundimonas sp. MF30-B]TFW04218.1 hypothetical protein E4M02_03855 [Brevundimonas sp. S30B]